MALNKFSLWLLAHCSETGNALILGLKFEAAEVATAELFEADKAAIGVLLLAEWPLADSEAALHGPPVDGV